MKTSSRLALALALGTSITAGCAPAFELTLPPRFVDLSDDREVMHGHFDMRATTPDGVVVGVQALDHRVEGSLTFWSEAVTRGVRDRQGYALLSEDDITASSGVSGHIMRFGRDLDGHAYRYTIALFVTPDHIFVVEAGGREEPYAALEEGIESSIRAMRL